MRRFALYAALILLSLVTALHGTLLQQKTATKPADDKQQAAPHQNTPRPPVASEDQKELIAQPQQSSAQQKGRVSDLDYTFLAFVLNVVLTIVALATAIAAILQARAAKESADIAINSQRSWIVERGVDQANLTEDWIPRITCHFQVFGNSPVRVIEAKFRFHVVNGRQRTKSRLKEPDLPDTPNYGEVDTLVSNPQMGQVHSPGDTFSVIPTLDDLFFEKGDIAAIKTGDKFLCIYGFISYRDAFSKSKIRESRFCYIHGERNPINRDDRQFVIGGPPAYNAVT